jgi:hypothetical protein
MSQNQQKIHENVNSQKWHKKIVLNIPKKRDTQKLLKTNKKFRKTPTLRSFANSTNKFPLPKSSQTFHKQCASKFHKKVNFSKLSKNLSNSPKTSTSKILAKLLQVLPPPNSLKINKKTQPIASN